MMSLSRYFFVLLLTVICFFGISLMILDASVVLFIKELYFLLFLLIMAGIALFAAGRNMNSGWMLFVLLFGTMVFNSVYLFESVGSGMLLLLAVIVPSFLGFFVSISNIMPRRAVRPKIYEGVNREKPSAQESSEDLEVVSIPERKPALESSEKGPAKKRRLKRKSKSAKKKSAAKKATRKTSRREKAA